RGASAVDRALGRGCGGSRCGRVAEAGGPAAGAPGRRQRRAAGRPEAAGPGDLHPDRAGPLRRRYLRRLHGRAGSRAQRDPRMGDDPGRGSDAVVRGLQERNRKVVHRRGRVRRLLAAPVRQRVGAPATGREADPVPRHARGFDTQAAWDHLSRKDRKLAAWMRRIGPIEPDPRWRKRFDPVDALARAILYQQLSGKAAATITGRVEQAIGSTRLHFDTLARIDDAGLRACGVSGNKTLALRDLARREEAGEIPDLRRMSTMGEDEIVAALVPIRGIGRWTVEMMLMFRLG